MRAAFGCLFVLEAGAVRVGGDGGVDVEGEGEGSSALFAGDAGGVAGF